MLRRARAKPGCSSCRECAQKCHSVSKSVETGGAVTERFLMTVMASLTLATLAAVVYVLLGIVL